MSYCIDRLITLIRQNADEPSAKAKYSEDDLISRIESSFQENIAELHVAADNPLLVRHTITLTDHSEQFLLPPAVEQLRRIARLSDNGHRDVDWKLEPAAVGRWHGPGIRLEGRVLRFDPVWQGGDHTVELMYVPNGDVRMHYGTVPTPGEGESDTITGTTIILAANPTKGTLDTRDNAYTGAMLRIVDSTAGYEQERLITAYDRITRTATVSPAFDPLPTGTVTYEVIPIYYRMMERIVALHVAMDLLAIAGNTKKYSLLATQYRKALRALRMQLGRMQNIVGDCFSGPDGRRL